MNLDWRFGAGCPFLILRGIRMTNKGIITFSMIVASVSWLCGGTVLFAQRGQGSTGVGVHVAPSVSVGQHTSAPPSIGIGGSTEAHTSASKASSEPSSMPATDSAKSHTMTPESAIDTHLTSNTELASRLQGLLPANANLQTSAEGFKNLGQFVAAAHVANNLNIPFEQLKSQMTAGASLGKAIQKLQPSMTAKEANEAAAKAKKQADLDIKASEKTKAQTSAN